MSAQHTPGPWQVSGARHSGDLKIGRDARLHAVGPDGDAVAMVFYDMKTGRGWKDAHLISAAPDLLEALSFIVAELDITYPDKHRMRDAAAAAIAKALGK